MAKDPQSNGIGFEIFKKVFPEVYSFAFLLYIVTYTRIGLLGN